MDSLITAAARALATGDPLSALQRVGLREDPPALALRGTAMAQLGDLVRARALLRRASRGFGAREALYRARCVVAEAEVALASRNLNWSSKNLDEARATLEAHRDRANAAQARYIDIRRLLLIGRLDEAEVALATIDLHVLPPPLRVTHELAIANIAVRRLRARAVRRALVRAAHAARQAAIPALSAEVEAAARALTTPVARLLAHGEDRELRLEQVEALLCSGKLVVDACRFSIRQGASEIALTRRPVLFTLARLLAEAWPGDVSRQVLVARAFRAKRADETYRARLRVEMGRLRKMVRTLADVVATQDGFAMLPRHGGELWVLARPVEEEHADLLALLNDGESWSSSALALALGAGLRSVPRALLSLARQGKVEPLGRGRARRWLSPPPPGFTTRLLLPALLPND